MKKGKLHTHIYKHVQVISNDIQDKHTADKQIKWNSSFDGEMTVYYVTHLTKQYFNIKPVCLYYILEFRNTLSHLL